MSTWFSGKKRRLLLCASTLLWFLLQEQGLFSQTLDDVSALRCGTQLVSVGDTLYRVQHVCGEPAFIMPAPEGWVWVYNFGPTAFIYYLSFAWGELRRMQVGGYGWYKDKNKEGTSGP